MNANQSSRIDSPQMTIIFADGLSGLHLSNGNLRVSLEAIRADHTRDPAPINRITVCRLILPLASADVMVRTILRSRQQTIEAKPADSPALSPQTAERSAIKPGALSSMAELPARTDNPLAPEVFTDGLCGFATSNGNMHLAFEVSRADHSINPAPVHRVIVVRVVMPLSAAEAMAQAIQDFVTAQPNSFGIAPSAPSTRTLQ